MSNEVLTSLLALAGTAIGSITGILTSARLTNFRLKQLEEKVKLHNNLVERMMAVEQRSKSNTHRLDNLER
jgi:hypothetical protein